MADLRPRETVVLVLASCFAGIALLPAFLAAGQPIIWRGVLAAIAIALGSITSGWLWMAAGRPAMDRIWIDSPWVAIGMLLLFVFGILPAALTLS